MLSPGFNHCKQYCFEHSSVYLLVKMSAHFFWIYTWGKIPCHGIYICQLSLTLTFSERLYQLTLLPLIYELYFLHLFTNT